MTVKLKALRPFTEHVAGRGMVVFNAGSVDSLPADQAERRTKGLHPFAVRVKEERKAEPKSEAAPPAPAPAQAAAPAAPVAATKAPAARRGRPPAAKTARPPRTAATTDAPVD